MKRIVIFILTLSFTSLIQAAKPGFYLGAGLGESRLDTKNYFGFDYHQVGGLGARAYAGYQFNRYFALEVGAAKYAKSKYYGSLNNSNTSLEYSTNALDLVMKAYLPITEEFQFYGIGGMAAVNNTMEFDSGDIPFVGELIAPQQKKKIHKIRPIYGVGVSYAIPKTPFSTSVEITRIQGLGDANHNPNALPPANMAAVTFTYSFD